MKKTAEQIATNVLTKVAYDSYQKEAGISDVARKAISKIKGITPYRLAEMTTPKGSRLANFPKGTTWGQTLKGMGVVAATPAIGLGGAAAGKMDDAIKWFGRLTPAQKAALIGGGAAAGGAAGAGGYALSRDNESVEDIE